MIVTDAYLAWIYDLKKAAPILTKDIPPFRTAVARHVDEMTRQFAP
jgi:hypothetical protein